MTSNTASISSKYLLKYKKRASLKSYPLDVYLQREEKSKYKSEFYDGKIVKIKFFNNVVKLDTYITKLQQIY